MPSRQRSETRTTGVCQPAVQFAEQRLDELRTGRASVPVKCRSLDTVSTSCHPNTPDSEFPQQMKAYFGVRRAVVPGTLAIVTRRIDGQGRDRRRSDLESGKAIGTSTGGRNPAVRALGETAYCAGGERVPGKRRQSQPAARRYDHVTRSVQETSLAGGGTNFL